MHNFDRTNLEMTYGEYQPGEYQAGEYQPGEYQAGEYQPGEYQAGEYQGEYGQAFEGGFGGGYSGESPFNETEEMELAAELLAVNSEAELEQFIGNLFRRASKAVGGFMRSPVGQQLGGIVKGAAKQALPMLGSALGNLVVPGLGGAIGGKLGSAAGNLLGLELEGLSQEDQEFEAAKQIVRFAGAAAGNAAQAPAAAPPQQAAQTAAVAAAQQFAPGLLRPASGAPAGAAANGTRRVCVHAKKGTWVRRGNAIVLYGA